MRKHSHPTTWRTWTTWASVLAAAALLAAACGGNGNGGGGGGQAGGGDKSDIVVGSILDETGPLNIYGKAMVDATKLAVADINDGGGLLGRKLNLVSFDAQSSNDKYTQYANELAVKHKAAVIMGGITSASREAMRPLMRRNRALYFYNEQYEGGVCDKGVFATGVVPSQQLAALIPWAIKNLGPKLYVLAADYNYGHISADWVKQYAGENGGQVLRTDFIPLDVSEFGATINRLQDAKPDVVVSLLVGGNHIAFYRQFAAAGLGGAMKIVSPTFGLGNEQVVLSPRESKEIVVAYPYFQELPNPENQRFVQRWQAAYGSDYAYITDSAATVWEGWHLWAEAVKKAGTTDRDKVVQALEGGVAFAGPEGTVTLDGPSHHLVHAVHLARTNDQKGFTIIDSQAAVPPSYEQSVCDLVKSPNTNKQFTPSA